MHVVLALVVVASVVIEQPPAEQRESPCTKYRGTVSGNDPSVSVTATLCRNKQHVKGTLVWASSRSGTNTRTIEGTWSGSTITLRDIALAGRPKPGWIFCKVDRYSLTASGDKLTGTYHSAACNDNANVTLERVR